MKGSANEIAALAAKAARGAGAPPDQAARFGQAAACHLAAGRDPDDLDAAIQALPAGPILALPLAFVTVLENGGQGTLQNDAPQSLIQSYADALPFTSTRDGKTITIDTNRPASRRPLARLELPEPLAEKMQALAARTYVPETEASRLAGAGAGLTDND